MSEGKNKNILINREKLIKKRKRKRVLRRVVVIFTILIIILMTVAIKTRYFNIISIEVTGLVNINKDEIEALTPFKVGDNIFKVNIRKAIEGIKSISYVEDVNISRELPNKIVIDLKEKYAKYYIKQEEKIILLDSDATVIEVKENIDLLELIELKGVYHENIQLGEKIEFEDERNIAVLKDFYDLSNRNNSEIDFQILDIASILDVKVYSNAIEVRIGTIENIEEKINVAINIIKSQGLIDKEGYIDVSFKGNPVMKVE
ncbi:MAG: FtsQ-type POTRA domain-containing protein [Clostridium sp.]